MKFFTLTLLLPFLVATALAIAPQKAVLVTYPNDTPDSVMNKAMDVITEAGGVITHEYKLFRGFAAKASAKTLASVTALGDQYLPTIEEDSIVSIDGDIIENGHTN